MIVALPGLFSYIFLHQIKTKLTPLKFKLDLSKGIFLTFANGIDPDQTQQNAESEQGHNCLLNVQEILYMCKKRVEVGNILSWRLIMKYFLRSFSPFR